MSEHLKNLADTFSKMAAEGKMLNENWNIPEAHPYPSSIINPIARAAIRDAAVRVAINSVESILEGDQLQELVSDPPTMVIVYRHVINICLNKIEEIEKQIAQDEAAPNEIEKPG